MSTTPITAATISGTLRTTWVHDGLAHVLEHAESDEPSGTWTGLACPGHGLRVGSDVDAAVLLAMCADGDVADLVWEAPANLAAEHSRAFRAAMDAHYQGSSALADQIWQELQATWSRAWAANYAVLELMQQAGISRFAPVKPQCWVVASFEHHCGPHSVQHPHVHNIVITALTTGPAGDQDQPG
jgi:hypothetical protein